LGGGRRLLHAGIWQRHAAGISNTGRETADIAMPLEIKTLLPGASYRPPPQSGSEQVTR